MEDDLETKLRKSSKQPFSVWEQRAVVRFLHALSVDPSEIHKNLHGACGESTPTYKEVKCWVDDLEETKEDGETVASASAGSRIGPGIENPTDPALVARIEYLLMNDRRISVERAASMACVSMNDAAAVITNVLGLKKVCERWVPRLWTPEQRAFRISVSEELISINRKNEGTDWLNRLIVGDEAFAMYYCPEINGPIPKKPSSEIIERDPGGKYKPTVEPKRVYCLFFYDVEGFLAAELQDRSHPPDAEEYIKILQEVLVPAIRRRRQTSEKNFYLLHDPTPAHSSLDTQKALKELGIITLPNAPASPDLEPNEFWLLRDLFTKVDGLNFKSMADLWMKVQRTIYKHPDAEFAKSIRSLPERWNLCIDKQGLYIL